LKILFLNKIFINNIIDKIFIIYKNFDKINFINLNKYNERFIIYYILNLLSFLNNFFLFLFIILNKSLQFNSLTLKLFLFLGSLNYNSIIFSVIA
jgi:hypothetical protein